MATLDVEKMWNIFLELPYVEQLKKEQLAVSRFVFEHLESELGPALLDEPMSVERFYEARIRVAKFLTTPSFGDFLKRQMTAAGHDQAMADGHVSTFNAQTAAEIAALEQKRLLASVGAAADVDRLADGEQPLRSLRAAGTDLGSMTVAEFVEQHAAHVV